jgi:hypothetical protein
VIGVRASDSTGRLAQLVAAGVLGVALVLFAVRFQEGAEAALEAPLLVNAAAIAGGLAVAALILAGMRRLIPSQGPPRGS